MMVKTIVHFSLILMLFSYGNVHFFQNDKNKLSEEDYVIINVFLEQFEPYIYLDLSIEKLIDSNLFANSYQRKIEMYESFEKLCQKNILDSEELDYETNFSCSIAESYKVYKDLFSEEELKLYSYQLSHQSNHSILINFEKILVSNIKPANTKNIENNKQKILKIHGIYYNQENTKVIIEYSLRNKILYHVLKKENNTLWKNIINF